MEDKKIVKVKLSTIIVIVLLIVLIITSGIFAYKCLNINNKENALPKNTINTETNTTLDNTIISKTNTVNTISDNTIIKEIDEKSKVSTYTININELNNNKEEKSYKIDNVFTLKFSAKKDNERREVSVNDGNIIYADLFYDNKIKVYTWNEYFIYTNNDVTDFNQDRWFIIDKNGNIIKEFYDLDEENKGMFVRNVSFESNELIITCSRVSHFHRIDYKDVGKGDSINIRTLKEVPANTAVNAKYIYEIENGTIVLSNPKIIVEETFKQYVQKYKDDIIKELKTYPDYKEGLVEDFLQNN